MPRASPHPWDILINEITEIWNNANGQQVRVCSSFGTKSMILISAAMTVSKEITIFYVDPGRQSETLKRHTNRTIETLRKQGAVINIEPIECHMFKEDLGTETSKCPVMALLKDIPKKTIDIVGSVNMSYDSEKIRKQRKAWRNNKNRIFPLWDLDSKTLFYLHKERVPHSLQFPLNSVTTCNSPLCPIIPESALKNKHDWSRKKDQQPKKEA